MAELTGAERIHVVGAGGAGMSALARLLAEMGHTVTGSDRIAGATLQSLADVAEVWSGHRPERAGEWDLVVRSTAVPPDDPEVAAAAAQGVTVWERPELLDVLTQHRPAVGITGTHGKTTTTALAVVALHGAGFAPSFVVGGELADLGVSARFADPDLFVLESDEAFGTFLSLHHRALLVTNVEADHLDHYGDLAGVESAFRDVATRVDGPVVVGIDDDGGRRLAGTVDAITYGDGGDWRLEEVVDGAMQVEFTLRAGGESWRVAVPRPGLHMARNAAGVLALLSQIGVDVGEAAAGIASFAGVRRRFEVRGTFAGVTIVDDYAHHPTEIAANIAAARGADWNQVWAVFQPHRYTRTAELARGLGESLSSADRVVVTDVYPAGEQPMAGVTGALVAESVRGSVDYLADRAGVAPFLAERVAEGDLVLVLGAGDISEAPDELIGLLGEAP